VKNKKATISLLVTTLAIWGWIIYKIHHDVGGNHYKPHRVADIDLKKNLDMHIDHYLIHEYTRDPFLGILTDTITKPKEEIIIKKPPVEHKPLILPRY